MGKKKIRIFIQKPWRTSDSPYYKSLREFPPKGVEYVNFEESNLIQNKKRMVINDFLKQNIKKVIRNVWSSMPNLHFSRNANSYDLIHCAHCMSLNKKPWICNIEYAGQFWASGPCRDFPYRRRVLKYLESDYCKKIVAWTEWTKREIINLFPEIKNKVEVVYPGIPFQKFKKRTSNKIKLLFVSRKFYFKGGLYAVEVMNKLTKKFVDVEGVIVSDIPKEILDKYSRNKKIKFIGMVPQKKLFKKIYPSCDIFVYPSLTDTFGFPITEAMSFGLPVVGVEGQSRGELIENGKTGFIVKMPFNKKMISHYLKKLEENLFNHLVKKTAELIKNKKLRQEMSKGCLKLFETEGKFSVEKRNKKLDNIYRGAIR